jgi:DNA-binding IclR family transcriptional regulator
VAEVHIPDEVRRLIAERIATAEMLEILLLLEREPERGWTADEISRQVFTVPAAAIGSLEGLVAQGLAASDDAGNPTYRYAPATPDVRRQVAALADAYRASRVAVIQLVFAKPADPLRSFADAFRVRRD